MTNQRRQYTPRPYQKLAVEFALNCLTDHGRCALWEPPGMGKTSQCYSILSTMELAGMDPYPALVLGPLRVARDVWPDEAGKWEHLRGLSVINVNRENATRLNQRAQVFTTNYEQIPWLAHHFGKNWPFRTVIADESTKLKSYRARQGGTRAKALGQVAWLSKYWINLTGTPAPNGLQDLWGQTWFLDKGKRLGSSYGAFVERWFRKGYDGFSIQPMKHSDAEIHELLKDICLSLDPKDWFNLKEPIANVVKVKLPEKARKIYDEFEATMFAELMDGDQLEVFNAAALTMKCLQLANGAVYHGEGWKPMHDAKIEALESIVEEWNRPLLVAYQFRSDKERILKAFPKAAVLGDKDGMARFRKGDAKIGLCHPQSVGHGVDGLQSVTNVLIRFGHNWNLEERLQLVERIGPTRQAQAGLDRPVYLYDIIAEDTIDTTVLARHESKREVQDLLLQACRHLRRA